MKCHIIHQGLHCLSKTYFGVASLVSVNPLYKSVVTSGYIYLCTNRSLFQKQSRPKAFHVPIDLKPNNGYFCTHWRPI